MCCTIRVDLDGNAVHSMLWTATAARYGRRVWPSLAESRAMQDVMLDSGRLIQGMGRVYGELSGFG